MTISWAFLLLVCACTTLPKGSTSFRLQLHHVDAKANITMAKRLSRAAGRTQSRLASFSGVSAPVYADRWGDYITEYAIGSPAQAIQAIVDSMSDLVWTQSSTCHQRCFAQELGYYNFARSDTDKPVPCDHSMSAAGYGTKPCMGGGGGNDDAGTCRVRATFYDDVAGDLRTELFRFGPGGLEVVRLAFGCMSEINFNITNDLGAVSGVLGRGGASGVLGLGRGALSLTSQVRGKRFSYCLTRYDHNVDTSTLFVGPSADLSGNAPVTSTRFAVNPPDEHFSSFYYLPLTMIGFDGLLSLPQRAFHMRHIGQGMWAGGVVISTSTPVTYLLDVVYTALRQRVSWQLGSILLPSPIDGPELCVAREDATAGVEVWRQEPRHGFGGAAGELLGAYRLSNFMHGSV